MPPPHSYPHKVRFKGDQKLSITEMNILTEHLGSALRGLASNAESIALVLHDTMELSLRQEDPDPIGILKIPADPPARLGGTRFRDQ